MWGGGVLSAPPKRLKLIIYRFCLSSVKTMRQLKSSYTITFITGNEKTYK